MNNKQSVSESLSCLSQAASDLLAKLSSIVARFDSLKVTAVSCRGDATLVFDVICMNDRKIFSTPILTALVSFCNNYELSFYVDVDTSRTPRFCIYS